MSRMTGSARANRAVIVRLADAVALRAAAGGRRRTLDRSQRMRGAAGAAWLIALRELDLFWLETRLTVDRGPRRRRMPAAEKLLIDRLVTAAAVASRQLRRERESVMILLALPLRRLMTVKTVHALLGVRAHLVLVDDGVLLRCVTLGALPRRAH